VCVIVQARQREVRTVHASSVRRQSAAVLPAF
jgi:hypothetical protein